jgi:STE24 endopeptidase
MNEDRAARYHRRSRRASLLSWTASGVMLTALLITGGAAALRDWATNVVASTAVPSALQASAVVALFVVVLAFLQELLSAPLAFYRGFLLERQYGLSHETARRWLLDRLKSSCVSLALAVCLSTMIYPMLRRLPGVWWIVAALSISLVMIGLAIVAPVLLFPIFYRCTPLRREALRARLVDLAERAGATVVGAYEWTLSDRTRRANAALTGIGRTRRILISDTLLSDYSDEEIEVVLAHELSHHVHHDIWRDIACESIACAVALLFASRMLVVVGPWFGVISPGDVAGLPLIIASASLVAAALRPLSHAVSRAHELRADRYALELTKNPTAFISAMRRLGAQNLAEDRPSRSVEILFYTHPPMARRIAAAEAWAGRTRRPAFDRELTAAH